MDEANHIQYKIVIKTRKDKSIGVKLTPNCLGNTNVFVKPNEQNKARFDSAMARKCAMKWNVFVKPDEQNKARFNSAMARKGAM